MVVAKKRLEAQDLPGLWVGRLQEAVPIVHVHVSPVQQVRGVHDHHHAPGLGGAHRVAPRPDPVSSVRGHHHIHPWGQGQRVVGVEVAPKHAAIKALEPDHHTSGPPLKTRSANLRRLQPVGDGNLLKHVRSTVKVFRVRNFHNHKKTGLGKTVADAKKRGLVRRHVAHAPRKRLCKPFCNKVVPAVLDVFAEIHQPRLGFQGLRDAPGHVLPHHGALSLLFLVVIILCTAMRGERSERRQGRRNDACASLEQQIRGKRRAVAGLEVCDAEAFQLGLLGGLREGGLGQVAHLLPRHGQVAPAAHALRDGLCTRCGQGVRGLLPSNLGLGQVRTLAVGRGVAEAPRQVGDQEEPRAAGCPHRAARSAGGLKDGPQVPTVAFKSL
mmetsp:Transcript_15059/g.35450  ORF Transcript_15059/g.35450 Transcript_15059/m.35450 type:complete len:383 (-) Transcript_15059:1105-2253(-)